MAAKTGAGAVMSPVPQVTQYGRYQVQSEIGRGSMGVVYKALDPKIDRIIALKVLKQHHVTDSDMVKRFLREAKAAGRMSHSNIVMVYDVGQDHGTVYIAMELVEGEGLDSSIKKGALHPDQAIDITLQVAVALDYAHKQQIVHRDIKPSNIIVTPGGEIKITDFGIARI
ncbi:MAG: serine/threonine protein kinase, partial [Deltaproteobacteria bacterium]|nr:serine/threonine protein kinase [Deltaproteobacteria bacterium]